MTGPARESVIIGVGGNIGSHAEIRERLCTARLAIARLGDVRPAPMYRTAPVGPDQADFLNSALEVHIIDAQPRELIETLLELEHILGRDRAREERWGPRPIDLDVLLWGSRVIRTPELEVPHPRLHERRFALAPLADLLPDAIIPGHGSVAALLERVRDQPIEHLWSIW